MILLLLGIVIYPNIGNKCLASAPVPSPQGRKMAKNSLHSDVLGILPVHSDIIISSITTMTRYYPQNFAVFAITMQAAVPQTLTECVKKAHIHTN